MKLLYKLFLISFLFCLSSCINYDHYYALDNNYLARRQIETRRFEAKDEKTILQASAQVLQDLGYTIKESEVKLGFISGYKDRKADNFNTNNAFSFSSGFIGFLDAAFSSTNDTRTECYQTGHGRHKRTVCQEKIVYDTVQKIYVTLVTSKSKNSKGYNVRVRFARIVWNSENEQRLEQISDKEIYQEFFEKLSQSLFLTMHDI